MNWWTHEKAMHGIADSSLKKELKKRNLPPCKHSLKCQREENSGVGFQEENGVKENFSSVFLIISHLSLLDSRCGPIWHSGHSIYGSGIVSWPSIQPGLHASQSLPSIYCAVAPKKLEMGGSHSSADTFHLCAEGCLFHGVKKRKLGPGKPDCPGKHCSELLWSHWGFKDYFPGKQQLLYCKKCNCGVSHDHPLDYECIWIWWHTFQSL